MFTLTVIIFRDESTTVLFKAQKGGHGRAQEPSLLFPRVSRVLQIAGENANTDIAPRCLVGIVVKTIPALGGSVAEFRLI